MIDEMNDLVKRVKNCHIIGIILTKTQVLVAVLFLTSVSNRDLDLRNEQNDQVIKMSSQTYRVLKIINFEIIKP